MPGKNSETDSNTGEEKRSVWREILSWIEVIVIAVVLALAIDNFIIINATVPSGSMEKTILTGSRVLGTRFSYWFSEPQRGDIVVFWYQIDKEKDKNLSFFKKNRTKYIKRIIGLPGETVEIRDGQVYIDSVPLEEDYINGEWIVANGPFLFEVPEGCYLMLGDNRNNSSDARYWPNIAYLEGLASTADEARPYSYVPKEEILGKAYFCYWPFSQAGSLYSEDRGK